MNMALKGLLQKGTGAPDWEVCRRSRAALSIRRSDNLQLALHIPHLHGCLSMSEHYKPEPPLAGEPTGSPSTNDPEPSGRESPAGAEPGETVSTL